MFISTKIIELGSCAFRQPKASHSHCRFIHGYKLTGKFWFQSKELDENHWVVDFGGLKGLKKILQDQFDHTTCVAADDPALPIFEELVKVDACDLRIMPKGTGIERIAEWCAHAANRFVAGITENRCRCVKVEIFEHENNSAVYVPDYIEEPVKDEPVVNQSTTTTDGGGPVVTTTEPVAVTTTEKPKQKTSPGAESTVRTTNSWVDPKYRGKTKNTWLF
jgi:6-pyruvoyltetrahydropterin/6-carboxytetrahydropterin synthase